MALNCTNRHEVLTNHRLPFQLLWIGPQDLQDVHKPALPVPCKEVSRVRNTPKPTRSEPKTTKMYHLHTFEGSHWGIWPYSCGHFQHHMQFRPLHQLRVCLSGQQLRITKICHLEGFRTHIGPHVACTMCTTRMACSKLLAICNEVGKAYPKSILHLKPTKCPRVATFGKYCRGPRKIRPTQSW